MNAPPHRQHFLDLGEQAHFDLLHGKHHFNIALATDGPPWSEKTYPHDDAAAMVLTLQGMLDCYVSQNGFAGQRRVVANVAALASCFADLDVYKLAGLAGLTTDDLLDRMQTVHPWLPLPTVTVSSGRGFYVNWCLRSPLAHDWLPRWQAVQDALIAALADLGADAHAKNAAQVFRFVGTVNSRSGATVTAMQTGQSIAFEQLERLVLTHALPLPAKPHLVLVANNADEQRELRTGIRTGIRTGTSTSAQRRQFVQRYELANARMTDLTTLAVLRGSPSMLDYRHRFLYHYAVFGSWFWSGVEQAEDELGAFAQSHFADPERYQAKGVQTVLDRMEQGKQGVRGLYNGAACDRRYRMRNSTIIAALDISPVEQRELRTIVGKGERENRRAARRRESGMVSYHDRTAKRLEAILAGLDRGLTHRAIGEELGLTRSGVSQLLKRHRR